MRNRTLILSAAVLALVMAAPATANRLIEANRPAQIANSGLSVTPSQDWNRLSARPGRSTEIWTLDGHALNNLTYYAGIENGRPLFREADRRNRPLPRFDSTMLLPDIPTLLENSYRVGHGIAVFTIQQIEPAQFAGQSGLRVRYDFVGSDEVRRQGEAYGAIVGGRLYLVTYEAPAIHYFDASLPAAQRIIESATLSR